MKPSIPVPKYDTISTDEIRKGQLVRFWHRRYAGWHIGRVRQVGHKWLHLEYRNKPFRIKTTDRYYVQVDGEMKVHHMEANHEN